MRPTLSFVAGLLAGSILCSSLAAAADFPIAPDIAVTPDPEFLGERSAATAVILSNSASAANPAGDDQQPRSRDQCIQATISPYQKSITITAFPRLESNSSKAGGLHQVEHLLPQLLSQDLQKKHAINTPVQLNRGLVRVDYSNDQRLATQVQGIAQTHRTQFVVSGEVLDMSMSHPKATYDPNLYTRFVSELHDGLGAKTRFDKRDRHFSFQLSLRDGFTGQVLFEKRYATHGIWGIAKPRAVDFASPLFWQSDYGEQIAKLVASASDELARAIHCQPYIARVDARSGQQQIVLHSGANSGLRAGDKLELYQLVVRPINGAYQLYDTRLVNRNTAIELREVYPSHSVALVDSDSLLDGQYLAIAP